MVVFARKAEAGVGTLIIFTALLLLAALAAFTLLTNADEFGQKATSLATETSKQVSAGLSIVTISATDGQDGLITDFCQRIRLVPGSSAITLETALLTMTLDNSSATLNYRSNGTIANSVEQGYYTLQAESLPALSVPYAYALSGDYDDDALVDYLVVNETHLFLNLSGEGLSDPVSLGVDLSDPAPLTLTLIDEPLVLGSTAYATVSVQTSAAGDGSLPASSVTITPNRLGEGYFVLEYEHTSAHHVEGVLSEGESALICFASPRAVGESENFRIGLIPRTGTPLRLALTTPNVINVREVALYPVSS